MQQPPPDDLPAIFTHAEARGMGVSERRLYAWRDAGSIEQLGRGLFRRAGTPGDPDLIEIAARAPEATLCLTSALARHGLTDEIPASIDVAIRRSSRPARIQAPVRWHRFDAKTFEVGRTTVEIVGGLTLGLYGPERSIIDAFRLRHIEGHEQGIDALRRWLRRKRSQPATLLAMLRQFPAAERSIRAALEVLL